MNMSGALRSQPFSLVQGEALNIMAASEQASETTLNVESFLTSDIRHETALQGKDPTLAPLVERLKVMARTSGCFSSRRPKAMRRACASCWAITICTCRLLDEPVPSFAGRAELPRAIVRGHLHQGFRLPEAHLVFMTFDEIFGTRKRQPTRGRRKLIQAIFSPA